eukprot:CAMPEP_0182430892 /NCGR_PEP_ID=MMETSP1167-20130531/44619_1 /TAXON_ID=2988 /ORGANISM="Mallomonas Sp, Strain CCMP3275" /LENGTH=401 /DNA_ID=CAMNT_0024616559 /DNA_START=116 /DNA_END=1321 /DNA_ORIENTATION=-
MILKSRLAQYVVGKTVFLQFCPGTTLNSVKAEAYGLNSNHLIRSIPDKSVEETISPEGREKNLQNKKYMIEATSSAINAQSDVVKFTPIKISSMVCPESMETFSTAWNAFASGSADYRVIEANLRLQYPELMTSFDERIQKIQGLCKIAKSNNMSILIDAEESTRQPAIDYIARQLSKHMNRFGEVPTVYNTYQMYLLRSPEVVRQEINHAENEGYIFAAKIVRGAYRISEGKREIEKGTKILQPSKQATDEVFDETINTILHHIASTTSSSSGTAFTSKAAVMIATHNTESVVKAVRTMERLGISPDHEGVHIAQLKGMADHLTVSLGDSGYNAHKLFAYGEFKDVMPFLIRRMEENKDVFGALHLDRELINQELTRRLNQWTKRQRLIPNTSSDHIKIA